MKSSKRFVLIVSICASIMFALWLVLTVLSLSKIYIWPFTEIYSAYDSVVGRDTIGQREQFISLLFVIAIVWLVFWNMGISGIESDTLRDMDEFLEESSKKRSRLGKIALVGLVISAIVAAVSMTIENLLLNFWAVIGIGKSDVQLIQYGSLSATIVLASFVLSGKIRSTFKRIPRASRKELSEEEATRINEDYIDGIIQNWKRTRARLWLVIRIVLLTSGLYTSYTVLTNFDAVIRFSVSLLLIGIVAQQLHTQYPVLAAMLWGTILSLIGIIYVVPYRIVRKQLRVIDGDKVKTLGRVVFVRGVNARGDAIFGFVYAAWYMVRFLKYAVLRIIRRENRPWSEARPSAHEVPIGDPYYLLGNPLHNPPRERFDYCVLYQANTEGWIRRRLSPTPLYTSGVIELAPFSMRVVGDGGNIQEWPRMSPNSSPHQELSSTAMTYIQRQALTYRVQSEEFLQSSAGYVDRGVKSDAELAKEAVRRFVLPSSKRVLGESLRKAMEEEKKRGR